MMQSQRQMQQTGVQEVETQAAGTRLRNELQVLEDFRAFQTAPLNSVGDPPRSVARDANCGSFRKIVLVVDGHDQQPLNLDKLSLPTAVNQVAEGANSPRPPKPRSASAADLPSPTIQKFHTVWC